MLKSRDLDATEVNLPYLVFTDLNPLQQSCLSTLSPKTVSATPSPSQVTYTFPLANHHTTEPLPPQSACVPQLQQKPPASPIPATTQPTSAATAMESLSCGMIGEGESISYLRR